MFEHFKEEFVNVGGLDIFVRHSGNPDAPGLLLLHGYPQTSAMWEGVAPLLAENYHVICPDLRGYGQSSKPKSDPEHLTYSKREMAKDVVGVMNHFDHQRFYLGAHDRGARVAHRLAFDHAEQVIALALLDIAPTREMYANGGSDFATAYWHWFFLIQPAPLPEKMIGLDARQYWLHKCTNQAGGTHPFSAEALEEYLDAFDNPAAIHASCEDYRAAASIDIVHDNEEVEKLTVPLKVIWAKQGVIESCFDALALWRIRAESVEGEIVEATHYMAEEIPDEIARLLSVFFAKHTSEELV